MTPPDPARLAGPSTWCCRTFVRAEDVTHGQLPTTPVVTSLVLREVSGQPAPEPVVSPAR